MPGDPRQHPPASPRDLGVAIDWMLALARCGKTELARTEAENLLDYVAAQGGGYQSAANYRLQSASRWPWPPTASTGITRSRCGRPNGSQRRKKLIDRSFEALEMAIASGFDDRSRSRPIQTLTLFAAIHDLWPFLTSCERSRKRSSLVR